jgi:hypothetical protein
MWRAKGGRRGAWKEKRWRGVWKFPWRLESAPSLYSAHMSRRQKVPVRDSAIARGGNFFLPHRFGASTEGARDNVTVGDALVTGITIQYTIPDTTHLL